MQKLEVSSAGFCRSRFELKETFWSLLLTSSSWHGNFNAFLPAILPSLRANSGTICLAAGDDACLIRERHVDSGASGFWFWLNRLRWWRCRFEAWCIRRQRWWRSLWCPNPPTIAQKFSENSAISKWSLAAGRKYGQRYSRWGRHAGRKVWRDF